MKCEDGGVLDARFVWRDGKKFEKVIRVGLSGIKNVGAEAMQRIIDMRPYESYQDFVNKVDLSKVNKRVCCSLISVGCFDEFGINRASLLSVYNDVRPEVDCNEKQMTLFGSKCVGEVEFPDLPSLSLKKRLDLEEELLGVTVSGHLIDAFREGGDDGFTEFDKLEDGVEAEVFGIVKRFSKIMTKKGDDMAFVDLVGRRGELKITVFPRDFRECVGSDGLNVGDGIRIAGRFKESEEFGDAFIAKDVLVCKAI